jgi:hypothetical protein
MILVNGSDSIEIPLGVENVFSSDQSDRTPEGFRISNEPEAAAAAFVFARPRRLPYTRSLEVLRGGAERRPGPPSSSGMVDAS